MEYLSCDENILANKIIGPLRSDEIYMSTILAGSVLIQYKREKKDRGGSCMRAIDFRNFTRAVTSVKKQTKTKRAKRKLV